MHNIPLLHNNHAMRSCLTLTNEFYIHTRLTAGDYPRLKETSPTNCWWM